MLVISYAQDAYAFAEYSENIVTEKINMQRVNVNKPCMARSSKPTSPPQ